MSATAFVTTLEATILLSDGMAVNTEGLQPGPDMKIGEDRVYSRNSRKAHKLSENIGVLWTGNLSGFMEKFSDRFNTTSPKVTAQEMTQGIRMCIANSGFQKYMPEPWFNVNVHVFGYNKGKPLFYHIVKKDNQIVLDGPIRLPVGAAGCAGPFGNGLDAHFKSYLDPSDPIGSAREAFTATLDSQPNNLLIGGTIFCEVITNPGI